MSSETECEYVIERIGSRGDGVATGEDGPVYIPFTLPGEKIAANIEGARGRLVKILEPSEERRSPLCRHFRTCGGCSLQHLETESYLEWKRNQVKQAFQARGLDVEVEPVIPADPGTRRRAVLSAKRTRSGILLGYSRRLSHEIVDVVECPVLRPAIVEALSGLRALMQPLLTRKGEARLTVLETENGLDVSVEGAREENGPDQLTHLSHWAQELGLARLTVNNETIVTRDPPTLNFGGASIVPPPGAFVQATAEAEQALAGKAVEACKGAGRVADLFSGSGTFTFPLARHSEVVAIEADEAALAAIVRGARQTKGLKPVSALRRDLFREPLSSEELSGFDAVLFDPPRAGARAQAMEIARSDVPRVIAVSCNPATLARDARILVDSGYRLMNVTPVDQFLYSEHIEVVATLER